MIRSHPEQVKQWLDEGAAILIDVRERDEYRLEHVPDTTLHAPLSNFQENLSSEQFSDIITAASRDSKKVVLICAGGVRSAKACQIIGNEYCDIRGLNLELCNLEGGIKAWKKSGFGVVNFE